MTRKFLLIACILGMTAVVFGAFGAHILKKLLSEQQLQTFEIGVRYQFYHTFALLATAILSRYVSKRWTAIAGWLFLAGVLCFSGSLYLLVLSQLFETEHLNSILGPVTPIGGVLLIGGWASLFRACFDYSRSKRN